MPEPRSWRDKVPDVGTMFHRARLVNRNNEIQVVANYSGNVRIRVYDLDSDDADTAVYQASNAVATVVTNTIQTWDVDSDGYNFERGVTSNQLSREGGHTYRTEYYFDHTTEGTHILVFENPVEPAYGG